MKALKQKFNIIRIGDDISMESFIDFSEKLTEAEAAKRAVLVVISSHGGDAYAALAYADRIRLSTTRVETLGYGLVASAAVLILASGHYRRLSKEAWVMVHEDSSSYEDGINSSLLLIEAKQQENLEKQWNTLLATLSRTSEADWAKMHKETTYLTAMNCLHLGLINEVA